MFEQDAGLGAHYTRALILAVIASRSFGPLLNWLKRKLDFPEVAEAASRNEERLVELIGMGMAAESRGDFEAAEKSFREAADSSPNSARAHLNLGMARQSLRDLPGAVASYERAIALEPTLAVAHYNLALVRLATDSLGLAEKGLRRALELNEAFPEAWVGLAEVLEAQNRNQDALDALNAAMELRPGYVGAMFNAALLLRKLGRLDESECLLRSVPEQSAEFGNAAMALAAILRDRGETDDAVGTLRIAANRAPQSSTLRSELLFTLGFSDRVGARELFAEHLQAGKDLEAVRPRWKPAFDNLRDPEKALRVGYLSGDFRMHSVAAFTEFLFTRHRRDRVRIFAYSSTPAPDAMTARISAAADVWRDFRDQPDAQVAQAIMEDGIDILVDLSGHTAGGRLGVLAGRAAPVQMTWLGYMNTTGLAAVDYRISDAIADPPGMSEHLYTERLARMPHSQWCFRPPESARMTAVQRDRDAGAFTFGSMNQYAKISGASISLWIAVLRAVPDARLRVVNVPRGKATAALEGKLCEAGIDRQRFDLVERVPQSEYYAQFSKVDACLDSTPYSGGTTSCDALFLGVPVLTLVGERPISRSTASLLAAIGASEWVSRSPEEFVAKALHLSMQKEWSTSNRVDLRARMMRSPLMDEERFTRDLEDLYRRAWADWCAAD